MQNEDDGYPRVGQPHENINNDVVELVLSDYVTKLTPPDGVDLKCLDPNAYFITSGDAIQKSKQLKKDLYAYAGKVRNIVSSTEIDLSEFEKACWTNASSCVKMINDLIKARGDAIFLETEWVGKSVLVCRPKNPRVKPPVDS